MGILNSVCLSCHAFSANLVPIIHDGAFRVWLRKELPGFLKETDRKLFDDILEVADGERSGGGKNAGTVGEKSLVPAD